MQNITHCEYELKPIREFYKSLDIKKEFHLKMFILILIGLKKNLI